MWTENIVKFTPAIITLIVGVTASIIAFLQYRIAKDKLRLDLFSKRLEAYEKLQEFLIQVLQKGTVEDSALPLLAEARYKSRFIFGHEIESYFEDLWSKAVAINTLYTDLHDSVGIPDESERRIANREHRELKSWFRNELQTSPERYEKYLRFH